MKKKIAVILDEYFEDIELTEPVDAFKKEGHDVTIIGLERGKIVTGKKLKTRVEIEKSFDEVKPEDFDALLIPGGYSPDRLRAHDSALSFVKYFMKKDKPVFTICHGPQILITTDSLRGRKATGWKSITQDMKNAGVKFYDDEVIIDGNLITSRGPGDVPKFIEAITKKLNEKMKVKK